MAPSAQTAAARDLGGSLDRPRAALLRPVLMTAGVVLAAAAALALWLRAGGQVSTDDAYVRAAKLVVSTDISGIVSRVEVREGQAVHRGDVLFRLDPLPFRYAAAAAQARLDATGRQMEAMKQDYPRMLRDAGARQAQVQADQADLDRFSGLVKGGGVTRAEYDTARFRLAADRQLAGGLEQLAQVQLARLGGDPRVDVRTTPEYREAEAKLAEAQRQLDHAVVRAPFDGIATRVDTLQPGQYLAAASAAMGLVSGTDLWIEAFPKETQLTWAKPGDRATIRVDSYPGRSWDGVLESIGAAGSSAFSVLPAQNATGNWVKVVQRMPIRVRIAAVDRPLLRDGPVLRDGMSVDVTIETGHRRVLQDLLR